MAKRVEIRIGHNAWSGRTKTEAQEAMNRDLERLLSQDFSPVVLVTPDGSIWVASVTDTGFWKYSRHCPLSNRPQGSCHGEWTRQQAENAMRRHIAQWVYAPGIADGFNWLARGDSEGFWAHKEWVEFQERNAQQVA